MHTQTEDSVVIQKTRELCQAILDEPEVQALRKKIDAFMADDKARGQYDSLMVKGQMLHEKQHSGVAITDAEVEDFETQRTALLNNPVAHAFLEFSGDITWTKVPQTVLPSVHITNQQLSPDGSQLSATVVNDGNTTVHGLTVAAVLFDASDNAEEASKSAVPDSPAGVSEQVVFTWPTSSVPIVRAELTPIPALPPLQTP